MDKLLSEPDIRRDRERINGDSSSERMIVIAGVLCSGFLVRFTSLCMLVQQLGVTFSVPTASIESNAIDIINNVVVVIPSYSALALA